MILDGAFEMWDWLTKKKTPAVKEEKEKVIRVSKAPEKTAKELATEKGEPYVAIIAMDIDPNNLHQGAFELDWNEIFIARLVKAGYMMKPTDADSDIVDRWFQNVCRHVVMETWEQEQAIRNSGAQYVRTRDIGDGRTEIS
jgi:hypothetical protein